MRLRGDGSAIVRATESEIVSITEIVAEPLFATNTSFASGALASDQGRSPTAISATTAPAASTTLSVPLSGLTFQTRSAPLLLSTISVVEWCGAATGVTPCSGSHLVGSFGNASELSPMAVAVAVGPLGRIVREGIRFVGDTVAVGIGRRRRRTHVDEPHPVEARAGLAVDHLDRVFARGEQHDHGVGRGLGVGYEIGLIGGAHGQLPEEAARRLAVHCDPERILRAAGARTVPSILYWPGCATVNASDARCGLVGPLVDALPLGSEM